jgi:subtilisin-like proprotein convertase family protein
MGNRYVKAKLESARSGLAAALAIAVAGILHLPTAATAAPALDIVAGVASVAAAIEEAPYYIVVLKEPALASYAGDKPGLPAPPRIAARANRLDVNSPAAASYVQYLQAQQQEFLQSLGSVIGRTPGVMGTFQHAINAVAIKVTAGEAAAVERMATVALVDPGRLEVAHTDAGPTHIGAPSIWTGTGTGGLPATRAEGVVFGAIDSGINFTSPSFATVGGDAYVHVNPFGAGNHVGTCAPGGVDAGNCTDKLIGAYDFVFAICSDPSNPCGAPGAWVDEASATDNNGHGTHTASTAAGNATNGVLFGGAGGASVPISGVANHANLIAYDTCFTRVSDGNGLCPTISNVAAANQAVADGVVDVLGYSISGGNSPWTESVSLAFLGAVDAGIIVSASGGNSGPAAGSVAHREPWTITVAASTHNRDFFANPLSIVGPGAPPPTVQNLNSRQGGGPFLAASQVGVPIGFNAADPTGCVAVPAGTYTGLALIRRGACSFTIKINNAQAGGATGVIISQNVPLPTTIAMGTPGALLPAAMVSQANGAAIEAFIAGNPAATASWLVSPVNPVAGTADVMAGFSSRGPSTLDALKPDVTAPGVAIFAAYAGAANSFNFLQGTSMSQPHNAGAAALLRALHPTWTPMEIKSALMLSSRTTGIVDENGTTPSDAFDRGAGRLDLTQAGVSGLVLNETGIRFSQANPAAVPPGDPKTLNLASYQIGNCEATCSFTRRVRSTLATPQTWNASVVGPVGLVGTVTPSSFTILPGQTREITVNLDVTALTPAQYAFAEVLLTPPTSSTFSSSASPAIPDNLYRGGFGGATMACSTVDTNALPPGTTVNSASVQIGLTHTWVGDLVAKLQAPSGTVMGIFSRPGFAEVDDTGLPASGFGDSSDLLAANPFVVRDGGAFGAESLGNGATLPSGGVICRDDARCEYFAERGAIAGPPNAFADLNGQNARGIWTLCVGDRAGGDTGSLGNWSLTLATPTSATALHMPIAVRPAIPPTPPAITVTPATLAVTLAPDVTGSQTFAIGNTGETALDWTIDEAVPTVVLDLAQEIPAEKYDANRPVVLTNRLASRNGPPAQVRHFESDVTDQAQGGTITLSLDDGTAEDGLGLTGGSQIIWFNRFTPAAASFPFALNEIQVLFQPTANSGVNVGELIDLHVFTDADGNPANGAVLAASFLNQVVGAVGSFNTYTLATPVQLTGPGDVLIAVVNRTAGTDNNEFPAAIDTTTSSARSWVGEYGVTTVPSPPTLPAPGLFGEVGGFGFPGNWLIRGLGSQGPQTGCASPQDVPWISVTPTSGTTAAAGTSTVTVNYDPTGLAPATYSALLCIDSNDPVNPTVELPVSMTVAIPVDGLFSDGFEDPPAP